MHATQFTPEVWVDIRLACELTDAHERGIYGVAQWQKEDIGVKREDNVTAMELDSSGPRSSEC